MKSKFLIIVAIVAMALWVVPASATTFHFEVATTMGGQPVAGYADLTPGAGTLLIDLVNTQGDPVSVIQNFSDLFFNLSSGPATVDPITSITTSSGIPRTVAADGSFTDGAAVATGWEVEVTNASEFEYRIYVLGTAVGPKHTIIGPPIGPTYPDSQGAGSIAGNVAHNPFLFGDAGDPVHFELALPGVTASTVVESVTFSFGTTEGNNVVVPLPPSVLLMGSGLLGVGLVGWRRRRSQQA